ncbi:MAG: hypothetical protein OMM_12034 [Candidatus Magnetoglobus multicellularis str. Araruama]|uniref:Uncharacterized protein n=1 Tax=Candidatus Magnetoglobus multicellularis str. Araruama TaxID=890399 RepID=A0A1V1NWV3_9BACT|nr:MAG: hypothetical protein OMM_12034 [Candidatus Magnetoglobus multicellularis str. Araruama]
MISASAGDILKNKGSKHSTSSMNPPHLPYVFPAFPFPRQSTGSDPICLLEFPLCNPCRFSDFPRIHLYSWPWDSDRQDR